MVEICNNNAHASRFGLFRGPLAGVAVFGVAASTLLIVPWGGPSTGAFGRSLTDGAVELAAEGAAALIAFAPGPNIQQLDAVPHATDDADGDGLVDAQELLEHTSPFEADTDGDGFSDAEELARQSDPLNAAFMPTSVNTSGSMTARGEGGNLRLVVCIHEPSGTSQDTLLRIGALAQGNVLSVPITRFLNYADVTHTPGTGGSLVTTIDLPVHPSFIAAHGQVTFFLAAGNASTMVMGSAAKIDIGYENGELILNRPLSVNRLNVASQGGGSIRRPIPVTGNPPAATAGWVPGAICFQRTEVVGTNGPRMLHRIVAADCLEGWDTYCSNACSLSVGDEYETIDPWALLGS